MHYFHCSIPERRDDPLAPLNTMKTDSNESLTKEKSIIVHEERGERKKEEKEEEGERGEGEREDGSQLTIKCMSSSSVTKNLLVNG